MNKIVKKTLIAAGLLTLFSASVAANETLTVGATPVPHAEILEFVKPELAKQGVDLKIKVFNDFIQPNQQLAEKTSTPTTISTVRSSRTTTRRDIPIWCRW